jgi:hypothetical protein
MPVGVGDPQLRTGVRARTVADVAVGVVGRCSHVVGDQRQPVGHVVGQGEPYRVRQPLLHKSIEERMGGPGRIGADQNLSPGPAPRADARAAVRAPPGPR